MNLQRVVMGMVLSLVVSTLHANPYPRYPGASPSQDSPAEVFKQGIQQLTTYLANRDRRNSPPIEVFVDQTIAPFFDFAYMTQWTAGSRLHYMDRQEMRAMQEKLRRLFLAGMVEKLSAYRHGYVQFLPVVGNPRTGEVTLRLLAYEQGNPYPQRLNFRMYRSRSGWKVFDVSANGQSVLAFYRTQFALEERQQRFRQRYRDYPGPRYGYPN